MNNKTKEFIEFLDSAYGQSDPYMWSTYILPNGHFLNPENNEDIDPDMLEYEHADFFDYLPDKFDQMGEAELMHYAIKMNVTYPYLLLPKNRITPEQTNAIKEVIKNKDSFIYNIQDIVDRMMGWAYQDINNIPETMDEPLLIEHEILGSTVFDLAFYSARDVIKGIMAAYSKGTF